jgi:hypothetical protein
MDYWVVRLDAKGGVVWDVAYGGVGWDMLRDIVPTADGGFLLCGLSKSGVGCKKTTPHYGNWLSYDIWLVKVDAAGKKKWEQNLGTSGDDELVAICETGDGGFLVGIRATARVDGSKTCAGYSVENYWVTRLASDGSILWDQCYGGTSGGERLEAMLLQPDQRFLLGGSSASVAGGSKTTPRLGTGDAWIVAADAQGRQLWDNIAWDPDMDKAYGLYRALGGAAFVLGTTAVRDAQMNVWIGLWVGRISSRGAFSRLLTLPRESSFNFWLYGRTADGGFYAGGLAPDPAHPGTYDYRVLKMGPAALPAATDVARLLPLPDVQGDIGQDGFLLSLVGVEGLTYVTEYSTNLVDWFPLSTNTIATTDVKLRDYGAAAAPYRFYRARVLE